MIRNVAVSFIVCFAILLLVREKEALLGLDQSIATDSFVAKNGTTKKDSLKPCRRKFASLYIQCVGTALAEQCRFLVTESLHLSGTVRATVGLCT
jgi:hypothetical protein